MSEMAILRHLREKAPSFRVGDDSLGTLKSWL
jgi:hypothetical protein